MATVGSEHRLRLLQEIEDELIDGKSPYYDDDTGSLLATTKELRDACYILSNLYEQGMSRKELANTEAELDRSLAKLRKISGKESSGAVFQSVINDVTELHRRLQQLQQGDAAVHDEAQRRIAQLEEELDRYEKTVAAMQEKAAEVDSAAEKLAVAAEGKTSKEWADEYLQYINYDSLSARKTKELRKKYDSYRKERLPGGARLLEMAWLKIMIGSYVAFFSVFRERLFYAGKSYENIVLKWRFIRGLWLFGLFILACVYIVTFWNYDFETKDVTQFLIEKSTFLPLLAVLTIGFTFSSRNFKVNAHLLEQYKHRYIVAKTMNNLMTLDDLKGDGTIKTELLQQGSKVLFEFRKSGYMNKHEGEGVPTQELLAFIRGLNAKN